MPRLTKKRLLTITASCSFSYLGESVTVEYYPTRVLAASQETLDAISREIDSVPDGDREAAYAFLASVWQRYFASWDITEDDDEDSPAIPLSDGASLHELDPGLTLWAAAMLACREAAIQGKPTGTPPPAPGGAISEPAGGITSSLAASSRNPSRSRRSPSTLGARPGSSSHTRNGSTP